MLFAPVNKTSLHMAGMETGDEMEWFARQLGYRGSFCEFNVLDELWTSRVTSHIALKDVSAKLTPERHHRRGAADSRRPEARGQPDAAHRGVRLQSAQRRQRRVRPRGNRRDRAGRRRGAQARLRRARTVPGRHHLRARTRPEGVRRRRHDVPRPRPDRDEADGLLARRDGARRTAGADRDARRTARRSTSTARAAPTSARRKRRSTS